MTIFKLYLLFICFSRNETRAKNLFNVADCKMHWQISGDYLCVNVNRYSKIIRKEKNEVKYSVSIVNIQDLKSFLLSISASLPLK